MNNISIVGRITKDIEILKTATGVEYIRFNVAVPSEIKTAKGERQADFFVCVAWRETAKTIAKYFKKGSPIGLIGSMNSRKFKRPKTNDEQTIWELNIKNFVFISVMEEKDEVKERDDLEPLDNDDDLPF